jgi:predicted permease
LLSIFVSSILPVFLVAGVGFVLARFLSISQVQLSAITFNALAPCLVFKLLATASVGGGDLWRIVLFCVLMTATMGIFAGIGAMLLRLDRPTRAGFMLVVMFSNNANYGLPLVLFAFGEDALVFATVYFVTSAVLTYTVGVLVAGSGHRTVAQALVRVIKVPTIYGAVAAGLFVALAIPVPLFVMRPVALLSDAAVPMMLLVLGMQLAQVDRPTMLPVVGSATIARLLAAPLLAFAWAGLLGLSGAARQAAILQASTPAAVMTTILALEYAVAPRFVTSVVVTSTVLSPVTLALLIAWLQ